MPKLTEDYSCAVVYKISKNDDLLYIGSTADFYQRIYNTKSHIKKDKNCPEVRGLKADGLSFKDIKMEVLEPYPITEGTPLEMKKKLERRERELINEHNPKYNIYLPAQNREEFLEHQKEYHNTVRVNKDGFKERAKKATAKYRDKNKDTQEYKDKKKITDAKYFEKNAEKINEHKREKVKCPICTKMVSRSYMYRHKRLHN